MAEQGTRRHTEMGVGHVTHVGHAEALAIQRRHGACGDRLGARVGRESGWRRDAPPPPRPRRSPTRRRLAPVAAAGVHGRRRRRGPHRDQRRWRRAARGDHPHPPRRGRQLGARHHHIAPPSTSHRERRPAMRTSTKAQPVPSTRPNPSAIRAAGSAGAVGAAGTVWLLDRFGVGVRLRQPAFGATGHPTNSPSVSSSFRLQSGSFVRRRVVVCDSAATSRPRHALSEHELPSLGNSWAPDAQGKGDAGRVRGARAIGEAAGSWRPPVGQPWR